MVNQKQKIDLGEEVDEYLALKKKSTASTYRRHLTRFLQWYKTQYGEDADFDHLMDRLDENLKAPRRERKHIAEMVMVDYVDYQQSELGLANYTIRTGFVAIQNFLDSRGYRISTRWVGNMPKAVGAKGNGKQKWTLEQMKEFVEKAQSYRDKAMILVMFQSGMAINELVNLDYGDIANELESDKLPIMLNIIRQKTEVEYRTFIGADGVKYLKLYLETRKNLNPESPLFTKWGTDRRITPVTIQGRFRELAKELSFLTVKNKQMNPARPHSMRSAFSSRLKGSMDRDLIEYFMGHKLSGTISAYLEKPDDELREIYAQFEHLLSIETTSKDVIAGKGPSTDLEEMYQERIAELESSLNTMAVNMGKMSGEIDELRKIVNTQVEDMAEKIRGEILSKIESGELRTKLVDESEVRAELEP